MRTLVLALSILTATPALAASEVFNFVSSTGSQNILDDVALNVTAASRTITLELGPEQLNKPWAGGWEKLRVGVFFTWAAASTVTAQFTCTKDGTNYTRLTTRSCSAGTCTVYLATDSYTTGGASANFELEYDVRGCRKVKVLFDGASAGATDFVDVQATAVRD